MKFFSVLIVVSGILVVTATENPRQLSNANLRGFWDIFGFGSKENPKVRQYNQQPCVPYTTTTTPLPFVGPMCPMYPNNNYPNQLPPVGSLVNPNIAVGGGANAQGGNVYPAPRPEYQRPNVGLGTYQPIPQRPGGDVLIGGGANAQGGNVYPGSRPNGVLVGGPDQYGGNLVPPPEYPLPSVGLGTYQPVPQRPGGDVLIGGNANAQGGNIVGPQGGPGGDVLIGGGANAQGGSVVGPQNSGGGDVLVGGGANAQGGNVYGPQRPGGGVLVGGDANAQGGNVVGPQNPGGGDVLIGGGANAQGGNVYPGSRPGGDVLIGGGANALGGNVVGPNRDYPVYNRQFPYTPNGFFVPNPHLIPQQQQQDCPLSPQMDRPLCSTLEMLDRLQLRTMYKFIIKSGLEQLFEMTSNYTFFVPADPAFLTLPQWFIASLETDMKLLRAFVLNHFVKVDAPVQSLGNEFLIMNARPGGNRLRANVYFPELPYRVYTIDGAQILFGDLLTRSGRLNIINRVLSPNPTRNAAQYLQEIPEFSNFMSAVVSANMLEFLQGSEPISLFIPHNRAFNTFDLSMFEKNRTALRNFVSYHIVRGTYYSSGLVDRQYLTTLFDKEIRLSVISDGFSKSISEVNNQVDVLRSDITLLNGVAHVLSGVLSVEPDFYIYQQMNEFQVLNFGNLKKRNFLVDNQLNDKQSGETQLKSS